MSRYWE